MDLELFLESRHITKKEFAAMIGVTPKTISNYICRKRHPTLEIGRIIEIVTKYKVTIDDMIAHWKGIDSVDYTRFTDPMGSVSSRKIKKALESPRERKAMDSVDDKVSVQWNSATWVYSPGDKVL